MAVKPIPDGYHSVTPYLIMKRAADALEFYKKAFGATELFRMAGPDGKIGHAEFKIGDSHVMMADEHPDMGHRGPESLGGTSVSLMVYLPNVNETFPRAIAAGATQVQPLKDQFYGDRSGSIRDPFGHVWTLATHVEDVSPEEMDRRMAEEMKKHAKA